MVLPLGTAQKQNCVVQSASRRAKVYIKVLVVTVVLVVEGLVLRRSVPDVFILQGRYCNVCCQCFMVFSIVW